MAGELRITRRTKASTAVAWCAVPVGLIGLQKNTLPAPREASAIASTTAFSARVSEAGAKPANPMPSMPSSVVSRSVTKSDVVPPGHGLGSRGTRTVKIAAGRRPESVAGVTEPVSVNGHYEYRLTSGAEPQAILRSFLDAQIPVERFEVALPTLNEIFIEEVRDARSRG